MARPKTVADGWTRFRHVLRHFLPGLRHEKGLLAGSTLALLASVAFRLLEPWPLKVVLDHVLASGPAAGSGWESLDQLGPGTLLTIAAVSLVLIVTLRATSDYFKTVSFALIGNRVMTRIRGRLYRHLQSLSRSF
jgi:ATP-binding cassette subfamily B protein